ncbi:AAA family ATPase [Xylanimonas ulmi]|uniref:AAA family ATPase n=1 Tax=Xylanimonas ulmi TaxID=228973 RepID=UPI00102CD087|nr:AAA family ATPase [Xylanibacterium ulmi]
MADSLVMVNGLPGAGKSTLAPRLARALAATSLSKDAVKEALAFATPTDLHGAIGAIAMDVVWRLAARAAGVVVVDSWWFRPRDLGFARAGLQVAGADQVVEVWCDTPLDVARRRYDARRRHAVHDDHRDMAHEWAVWASQGVPLGIAPVVRVDTTSPVDIDELAAQVARLLT